MLLNEDDLLLLTLAFEARINNLEKLAFENPDVGAILATERDRYLRTLNKHKCFESGVEYK